jgi:hypothetical protein
VPVGDGQIRQGRAGIAREGDRLIQQGQAPDGPSAVQHACGFPLDVGLGEDGFDDLAHLAVVDDGVGVLVEGQDGSGVGTGDGLPALDGLIVRGAVGVDADGGVDLCGDWVPVQPGQDAGFGPGAGVVVEDLAFLVPGHLADREHRLDVCWHDFLLFVSG